MSAPAIQHTVSAVPAILTFSAIITGLNVIVSILVGLAALTYYYIVIGKELRERRAELEQLRQSQARLEEPKE